MMIEDDEDRVLLRLQQFCEWIGVICRELGIPYDGVDDDSGQIVEAIRRKIYEDN